MSIKCALDLIARQSHARDRYWETLGRSDHAPAQWWASGWDRAVEARLADRFNRRLDRRGWKRQLHLPPMSRRVRSLWVEKAVHA